MSPTEGQILTGALFNEPMRVETVAETGPGSWTLGLVGTRSERFRKVSLGASELAGLTVLESGFRYDGDGALLRLGLQAHALGIAWEFDPYFGLSVSRVDPLPHQLEAVYDHLLKLARVRFLLADDAGAGKTIMAGLLIRELQLRGLAERILIVAPSNLAFQWQRELQEKFDETFVVLKGSELRAQFGVNQWMQQPKVVTSLDLAKREEILPGLRQVHWDLVVVDEAHRMSARDESHKSQRYKLGELLRDSSDHILLLTATPHKGDPENFSLFLQLLDRDAYADVRSIRQAMDAGRAPFYLRRTKEAMVYFPERDANGQWLARKIFTKRIPRTVDFKIDGSEYELYREVTQFVKRQSIRAAAAGDDPRARAVGFLMALYQRRLASSTRAMRRSLANRADRLERGLAQAEDLVRTAPPDLPSMDELDEMEERDRERLERLLDAITLAGNADMVRQEIAELRALAVKAENVERAGVEAKLAKFEDLLRGQGFFDRPDQRLVLFTEFKDTLDYLVEKLEAWGFRVATIHGSMKPGAREQSGTRLHAEQQFREGAVQVLVATEAAGEGINLQVCNILFNYDIPWNPNRLEQRMGRIHRYGQEKDCLIFNFVATNTIEGHVLERLLDKLQEIRDALDDVDRLVDWSSSVDTNAFDEEAVELCAVALTWMLTTSNRFLRDRVTTALVNLLTGRLVTVGRLVGAFAGVDDPYVVERVYAVAYGVATRCHDPEAVGALATRVYGEVFASGSPPPHILQRDYARGVVERALYLRSKIDVDPEHIRPPYNSTWPSIPTEEDIKALLPDWSKGSHDSGELEWARNRIGFSVMDDDFARYVIGTNSSWSDWLSVKLEEPQWAPPPRPEDLLRSLVGEFSPAERAAWEEFEASDKAYGLAFQAFSSDWLARRDKDGVPGSSDDLSDLEVLCQELQKARPSEVTASEAKREQAMRDLQVVLSEEHAQQLLKIQNAPQADHKERLGPRFDLREIQRSVLWRVFDLGWTIKRFGHFDRFSVRPQGRDASKAERIGKKYQWIAYHEIMALVADHYQYRERFREDDGDQAYEGPWQGHFRDIDPSCTLKSLPGGTSWDGHAASWWGRARYDSWGDPASPRDWVKNTDDLPKVEDLLVVTNPRDGSRWVNGQGYFSWEQKSPADRESSDIEQRDLWYMFTGHLIRADDAESFLRWAEGVDFMGRWMPEAGKVYGMFLGEHAWAPASHYFQDSYYGEDGWTQPRHDCPVKVRTVTSEYLREKSGFDCSIEEGYTLRLPVVDLVRGLGIRWSGRGADFVDGTDQVVAQDPTAHSEGPDGMLLRHDCLEEFLNREKLVMCWAVLGEKRVISPGFGAGPHHPWLRMSGAYVLSGKRVAGFVKRMIDERNGERDPAAALRVVSIVRTAGD